MKDVEEQWKIGRGSGGWEKQWRMGRDSGGWGEDVKDEDKVFKPTVLSDVLESGHSKTARQFDDCQGAKLVSNIPTWTQSPALTSTN